MTVNLQTSLTIDECLQRLTQALEASRQFTGRVEGPSWRLNLRSNLSLANPKVAPLRSPVLSGDFIPLETGTMVQCHPPLQDAEVEWRRVLFILLPLLAAGALLLVLLDIASLRDWFLALILPLFLILVILARRAFSVLQSRAARREAIDFLRRVLEAEDAKMNGSR